MDLHHPGARGIASYAVPGAQGGGGQPAVCTRPASTACAQKERCQRIPLRGQPPCPLSILGPALRGSCPHGSKTNAGKQQRCDVIYSRRHGAAAGRQAPARAQHYKRSVERGRSRTTTAAGATPAAACSLRGDMEAMGMCVGGGRRAGGRGRLPLSPPAKLRQPLVSWVAMLARLLAPVVARALPRAAPCASLSTWTHHETTLHVNPTAPPLPRSADVGYRFGVKAEELEVGSRGDGEGEWCALLLHCLVYVLPRRVALRMCAAAPSLSFRFGD